jgi:hypothetical protein
VVERYTSVSLLSPGALFFLRYFALASPSAR